MDQPTLEMGQSSFSLIQNGLGYARTLIGLAWQSRLGFRLLPRRSESGVGPKEGVPASEVTYRTDLGPPVLGPEQSNPPPQRS